MNRILAKWQSPCSDHFMNIQMPGFNQSKSLVFDSIVPSVSLLKKLLILPLLIALNGCQSFPFARTESRTESKHDKKKEVVPQPPSLPTSSGGTAAVLPAPTTAPVESAPSPEADEGGNIQTPPADTPKIGLILGGGGLRSFAHIGVLQEFAKKKIPIVAVAGIEMGSLIGAIYSSKGQAFEVEWQMMKLKEKELIQKSLISGKSQPLETQALSEFLSNYFSGQKVEQFKIPFTCPSLNLEQQKVYVLTKGSVKEMLPYCLGIAPLFEPFQQNVAALMSLNVLADQLRQKGANYIIYVDLLNPPLRPEPSENSGMLAWNLAAEATKRKDNGVNYAIQVPLKGIDFLDFSKRRENLQKGQLAAQEALKVLMKELDL